MTSVDLATVLKILEETTPQAGDQFLKADRARAILIIGVECCLQSLMKLRSNVRRGIHTGSCDSNNIPVYLL